MDETFSAYTFISNQFGDRYLYEVNHNSLNKTGARHLHTQRFGKLLKRENALIIIVGSDSGTLLTWLRTLEIPSGTRVVVLELEELYDPIAKETQFDPENEWLIFAPFERFTELLEQIDIKQYVYINNIQLAQSLAAEDAFLPEYQERFYALQTELHQITWNIHASLGAEPFLIKQLENLGENLIPSHYLKDAFRGKTAVLLAGGPSLDEILPWVKKHNRQVVTLAVSRISRRLLEVQFRPDIIFSIDPHQLSFDVSKEMLAFWQDTLFVHMYHVTPLLLGQWRGKSVYLGSRFPWESDLNEESLPHPGPTVSNVALSTAIEMGFSRVILAGVDLCHSKTGLTHAAGSNEFEAGPQLGKICSRVETNGGWLAETTSDFAAAVEILDTQAKGAREREVRLINPAAGAVKIEHIDHVPLEDISLASEHIDAAAVLQDALPEVTIESKKNYYKKAIRELARARGQLLDIRKLSREAIHCNDGLFGRKGMKQDFKYKKRMDKIESNLNRKYAKFSRLVKSFGIREFLKLTRIDKDKEWEDSEIENTGRAYYEAYADSASALIKLVRISKKRLELRLEELNPDAFIEPLIEQWRQDRQPGRALIWLTTHNKRPEDLPKELRSTFADLAKEYDLMLSNTETDHMKRSRKFAELSGIRGKALAFFRQKNKESLQQLIRSLENHPAEEAKHYLVLAKGYLLEIEDKFNEATEEYQKLFADMENPLLEDCLRRIASLSVARSDVENGLLALETLTHFSPTYLIQYADLLRLIGSHQDAINVYLDYLQKVPGDIGAMIRLSRYYRELRIEEGARTLLRHVLTLDPDNPTALFLLNDSHS